MIYKLVNLSQGQPEGSLFNSYDTEAEKRALLFSLDCSNYPWSIHYNAECSAKRHQIPFFWVFVMTQPGIEPWSTRLLMNTLIIMPMGWLYNKDALSDHLEFIQMIFFSIYPIKETRHLQISDITWHKRMFFYWPNSWSSQKKKKKKKKNFFKLSPVILLTFSMFRLGRFFPFFPF